MTYQFRSVAVCCFGMGQRIKRSRRLPNKRSKALRNMATATENTMTTMVFCRVFCLVGQSTFLASPRDSLRKVPAFENGLFSAIGFNYTGKSAKCQDVP